MLNKLTLITLALLTSGCALPGSKVGSFEVKGMVTNHEGAPLKNHTLTIALPEGFGLSSNELKYSQTLAKYYEQKFETNDKGEFTVKFSYTEHSTVWLIPPLFGLLNSSVRPQVFIKSVDNCEIWHFVYTKDKKAISNQFINENSSTNPSDIKIKGSLQEAKHTNWILDLTITRPSKYQCNSNR